MLGHSGLDIVILKGENILATHDGVVLEREDDLSAGLGITLWNQKEKYKTYYWHNIRNLVGVGQPIRSGDILAQGDSTGWSTGDHLHFGLKKTNENGTTINWGNGFKGAIDPLPFLKIDMVTTEILELLYWGFFNRPPGKDAEGYIGEPYIDVMRKLMESPEKKIYRGLHESGKAIEDWAREK